MRRIGKRRPERPPQAESLPHKGKSCYGYGFEPVMRIQSVDIFRGLTILVMVFVNDIAGVKGLPWWTHHMPEGVSGMTYVDMVFSAFLFIVGISMPLAINRRLSAGESNLNVLKHVVVRSLSLVAIGYILANLNAGGRTWDLLAFTGILLAWSVYPKTGTRRTLYRILKVSGLVLLVVLVAIFRRKTAAGGISGLDMGYPEILGLIGFAYLSAGIIYLVLPKTFWWVAGAFAVLNAMNAASKLGYLPMLGRAPLYFWPLADGALASIVMGGVVFSFILFDASVAATLKRKVYWSAALAAVLFAGGLALMPLGISKNHATPTWCLFSEASSVAILLALYYVVDIKRVAAWAGFVKPAGSNTLLTYLLPWICSVIPLLQSISAEGLQGAYGVFRACLFTAFILALAGVLTKMRLRMQL
jgi:heparan-alpha-glucosaminide N-acetyltransferase